MDQDWVVRHVGIIVDEMSEEVRKMNEDRNIISRPELRRRLRLLSDFLRVGFARIERFEQEEEDF